MTHGGVVGGCEHEADAGLTDAAGDGFGRSFDVDAEGGEGVGGAGFRRQGTVAVLGDLQAGAGSDYGGAGGDIVGARGITAGADDVEGIGGGFDRRHLLAHGHDGAGDLVNGFTAHAQSHQQAADLAGRCLTGHHDVEGLLGLVAGERITIRSFCN